MTQTADHTIDPDPAARTRLLRLARYRTMQLRLERERRQQVSRRRLLALHGNEPWGWLAL